MPDLDLGLPAIASGCVATCGTFDGVHRGHRDILERLAQRGRALGLPALVVTFRPHPLDVVNPPAAPLLLTPGDEQLVAIADSGIEHVVVLPFTRVLASFTAADFVTTILLGRYCARELVIGYDHGLGRGRQGDAATLTELGRAQGFAVEVVAPTVDSGGVPISSSLIRALIAHGDLQHAKRALGRVYSLSGTVVRGQARGRELGFRTLNIVLDSERKLLPPDGVYAVRATSSRGAFRGMMNLGGRPTFGDLERAIEVHLFEAAGEWLGEPVSVELIQRLRDVIQFPSRDALIAQLGRDREAALRALTQA